ncbi:cobalt-precorrin-6A reductase [Azospirillum sp. TSO35-2]|uniref:cobalt-precorrin-6A reductase n=1 Tax=Azospirillum sp. TSO35-2 TaxID=716796 RepID=UPI000D604EF6|nr:cobalt-precorrin-6A reductase [Azospirillum sp. TSO35-2]PWC39061.1 cobalt-precorrin-6X reductase [Azospirillum sp. TSO35-2]
MLSMAPILTNGEGDAVLKALILGGTTEATALAKRLAGHPRIDARVSLAGRTKNPVLPPLPTRIGGFGGAEGLADYLRAEGIAAVIDATHPFAAQISANAALACARAGVPLRLLTRPAWAAGPRDRWIAVPDMAVAALAVRDLGDAVFLTIGRQEVAAFEATPDKRYLIRAVDPPEPMPALPRATLILDRGPFTLAGELALMRAHGVEVVVSKNSGGHATDAKLEAARELGLPVVMVERPAGNGVAELRGVAEAVEWLEGMG